MLSCSTKVTLLPMYYFIQKNRLISEQQNCCMVCLNIKKYMNMEKMPSVLRFLFIFVQIGSYNACATKMTKKVEHYSVSGHGFENPNVSFIVPKEVTIHFYVKHGEILPVSDAGQMWDSLEKNQAKTYEEVGYSPVETFQNGSKCLNGWLEYTTDFPRDHSYIT